MLTSWGSRCACRKTGNIPTFWTLAQRKSLCTCDVSRKPSARTADASGHLCEPISGATSSEEHRTFFRSLYLLPLWLVAGPAAGPAGTLRTNGFKLWSRTPSATPLNFTATAQVVSVTLGAGFVMAAGTQQREALPASKQRKEGPESQKAALHGLKISLPDPTAPE